MPRRIDALTVYGVAFLIFLYAPVLLLPMFSFNDNTFAVFPLVGFTTSAYVELANNDSLLSALRNSLIVGSFVSIFSTTPRSRRPRASRRSCSARTSAGRRTNE